MGEMADYYFDIALDQQAEYDEWMKKKREKSSDPIKAGLVCQYCKNNTQFIDSIMIYGKSYGMIYYCEPCGAYVGVHKGTDMALGPVANKELREFRKMAHTAFDKIARTGLINQIWKKYIPDISNRNKAYLWLSKQMHIKVEDCHIGMMSIEQCRQVIKICFKYTS